MHIKNASLKVLGQLKSLIEQLNDKQYAEKSPLLLGGSIGKHTRHVLEFYDIFIYSYYTGIINYDQRERNENYEKYREIAIQKIEEICEGVLKIDEDFSIILEANYSGYNGFVNRIQTSVLRELAHNLEHSIHHMAIIKIAVMHQYPKVDIGDGFGVAFSTLNYEKPQ